MHNLPVDNTRNLRMMSHGESQMIPGKVTQDTYNYETAPEQQMLHSAGNTAIMQHWDSLCANNNR
jgi:hypothetical protein